MQRSIGWITGVALLAAPALADPQDPMARRRSEIFDRVAPAAPAPNSPATQLASIAGREDLDYGALALPDHPVCKPMRGDPLRTIAERAKKTNIVIINESHSAPRHRAYIGRVLEVLRAQGYSIYAGETFAHHPHGHPDVLADDGFYTNEPIFGRTVRAAKRLGYALVAYEIKPDQGSNTGTRDERIEVREQAQVDNLMAAVFRDRPDAKVVIHVGFSHVHEAPLGKAKTPWMAARLKAATGRDPLTISQTACWSAGSDVVVATERIGKGDEHHVDLFVGHPRPTFEEGRASWRRRAGDAQVAMPAAFLGRTEAILVEARSQDQSAAGVPIDRVLLFPGERLPLLLPRGRYRVEGFTRSGPLDEVIVTVP